MFPCRTLSWILCFWSLIFTYTLLTHQNYSNGTRRIPLVLLCVSIIMCSWLLIYEKVVRYTKTVLWLAAWSLVICIGMILYTLNPEIDVFINIYITVFSAIASLFWCVVSHTERVTEPGLHWYIWSITTIITICCATEWFRTSAETAIVVYIVNSIIVTLINFAYLFHICKVQPSGNRRCKRLWRVIACFILSILLLIGSILHESNGINTQQWEMYIVAIQGIVLFFIFVDVGIGLRQDRSYQQLPSNENDVL